MEQNDHDYLVEELAKVFNDDILYGRGFLCFSNGKAKHLPAEELLKILDGEELDGET